MPDNDETEQQVLIIDPAAKTRAIIGGVLIALAWIISAATTILLVVAWPTAQTTEDATETVLFGAAVAAVATWYIVRHFLD
jgi:hypothetical protein